MKADHTHDITGLLNFSTFTHKFQKVKRTMFVTGEKRRENDAEHSFQLALTAWYLVTVKKLELNITKIIKYALAHDLVETYAGDVFHYASSDKEKRAKKNRENQALQQIKDEFAEFSDLHSFIEAYERKDDAEARFVYALDKLLPVINNYLDNGRSWKDNGVTFEMLLTKKDKVSMSKELRPLWEELIELVEKEKQSLFHRSKR